MTEFNEGDLYDDGEAESSDEENFVDYTHGRFYEYFGNAGGYVSVNPELFMDMDGISPTGTYHVYCLHPEHGSCTFILQQDEHQCWFCDRHPPFIDADFIDWIGEQIEKHTL